MSTQFTNISGEGLVLFAPTGHPEAFNVAADATVTIPADITSELDDAFIVGLGDARRAWPKALWAIAPGKGDE